VHDDGERGNDAVGCCMDYDVYAWVDILFHTGVYYKIGLFC
jgi:hypothetical protein